MVSAQVNREEWFEGKWRHLKRLSLLAAVGMPFLVAAVLFENQWLGVSALLLVPLIFWLVMVPLLHWKDRYVGGRSTLWGALILIETSGWFKIVYWLRHVVPDWKRKGRYKDVA